MSEDGNIRVRLTRLTDNDHTRTKVTEGVTIRMPILRAPFVMVSEPIDKKADGRLIATSEVQHIFIDGDGSHLFRTMNTSYKLEVLR